MFFGKHKLYGYKFQAAACPNGTNPDFSKNYPEFVSHISILYDRIKNYKQRLGKREEEEEIEDASAMSRRFVDSWGLLMYKGYQGATDQLCTIIPKKRPVRGTLS